MKKYDVALLLANTGREDKLALARMIIDMMDTSELYEPLDFDGSFEELKELEELRYFDMLGICVEERIKKRGELEVFEEKNYDVALALATAGNIEDARKVMEGTNPKKSLDVEDFRALDKSQLQKAEEIKNIKDLHVRLLKWLEEKNLPQPEVPKDDKYYYIEVEVGWKTLSIKGNPKYRGDALDPNDWKYNRELEKLAELKILDHRLTSKEELSQRYGFMRPNSLKFIDYVCIIGNTAWVIEGKKKLNYEAIGQVMVYSELFFEDGPTLSKVKKAVACEETDTLLESVCRKNDIEVFVFQ